MRELTFKGEHQERGAQMPGMRKGKRKGEYEARGAQTRGIRRFKLKGEYQERGAPETERFATTLVHTSGSGALMCL